MPPQSPGALVKVIFFFVIPFVVLFFVVWLLGNHLTQAMGILIDKDKLVTLEVGGILVGYSPKNTPDKNKLDFLDYLVQNAPEVYLQSKPKAVFFINSQEIRNSLLSEYFSKVGGVTIGNTIYLPEGSNYEGEAILKNYYLANIFFHEWTHVVQYQKILGQESLLGSALKLVNISNKSNYPGQFIVDYALKAGWQPLLGFPIEVYLLTDLQSSHKNDDYGASSIVESQATVAGYVMAGNAAIFSSPRVKWVEDFTGKTAGQYLNDLVSYSYGPRVEPSGVYSP